MIHKMKEAIQEKWLIIKSKFNARNCWYHRRKITNFEYKTGLCKMYMNVEINGCFNCYHCSRQCKIRKEYLKNCKKNHKR